MEDLGWFQSPAELELAGSQAVETHTWSAERSEESCSWLEDQQFDNKSAGKCVFDPDIINIW